MRAERDRCSASSTTLLSALQAGHAGPYRVGLTGSIGMGKSTVAAMFADLCVPLMDADAVVHALYAHGGAGVPVVQALFPDAVADGARDALILHECAYPRVACSCILTEFVVMQDSFEAVGRQCAKYSNASCGRC